MERSKLIQKSKSIGITIIAFLPIFIILYQYTFDSKIFVGGDNASYYALGQSISNGDGYANTHMAGGTAANHFPPGYPFIIGTYMTFFGESLIGVKILNGVFLFLCLIVSYLIVKRLSDSKSMAIVTTLFLLFNGHYLYYGSIMMSEITFSFFSLLGILFLLKVNTNKKMHRDANFILLILVIASLIYIRTTGIAMLGGVVIYFLFQKKILHSITTFGIVILLLVPWQIRSYRLGGTPYVEQLLSKNPYNQAEGMANFSDFMVRYQENASRYISMEIPHSLFASYKVQYVSETGTIHSGDLFGWLFGILLITLMTIAVLKAKKRKEHYLLGLIIGFTAIILLLWPSIWYGTRFIMPLIPLLYYLFFSGANHLIKLFFHKILKVKAKTNLNWIPYMLLILIMASIPKLKLMNKYANSPHHFNFRMYFQLAEMSRDLPENSVIVCRKPHLFHLVSDQIVCNFMYSDDMDAQREYFKSKKITHVVLDQLGYPQTQKYLGRYVNYHSGKFKITKQTLKPVTYLLAYNDTLGYEGERKDGKRSGHGTFTWDDGSKYVGEWEDNMRSGYGVLSSSNGMVYKSQWKNDKKNGKGTVILNDSSFIEAMWINDRTDTLASMYSKDSVLIRYVKFGQ